MERSLVGGFGILRWNWSLPCGPDDVIDFATKSLRRGLQDRFDVVELRLETADVADYVVNDVVS